MTESLLESVWAGLESDCGGCFFQLWGFPPCCGIDGILKMLAARCPKNRQEEKERACNTKTSTCFRLQTYLFYILSVLSLIHVDDFGEKCWILWVSAPMMCPPPNIWEERLMLITRRDAGIDGLGPAWMLASWVCKPLIHACFLLYCDRERKRFPLCSSARSLHYFAELDPDFWKKVFFSTLSTTS